MRLALTIDVEWAPDFVIDWMYERIKKAGIGATWFVTHGSDSLLNISKDATQEIGLHPNFFPGSSQGDNMDSVLKYLMDMYPKARGIRAHALLDSTRHQMRYGELGFKYVSNVITWNRPSEPFIIPWADMVHIPISWEDDVACLYIRDLSLGMIAGRGDVWVLNFHPLYCYTNDNIGMPVYKKIKTLYPDLTEMDKGSLELMPRGGRGVRAVLDSVLKTSKTREFVTLGSYLRVAGKKRS